MRRFVFALGLVACSSSPDSLTGGVCEAVPEVLSLGASPHSVAPPFDPWDRPRRDASPPIVPPAPAVPAIAPMLSMGELVATLEPPVSTRTAAPTSSLMKVAVSDDGTAAMSIDVRGGLRLWPSLDGRREPIMVTARTATTEVSLEHTNDPITQLLVARRDDAGAIEVLRFTTDGALLFRGQFDHERPFVTMRALRDGVIALRDDGVLVRIALDATLEDSLVPRPGERVSALLYRHGRALALMSSAKSVVGQWITTAPLAWGARTPALSILPDTAALSPDHAHVAAVNRTRSDIVIVSLATGKTTTTVAGTSGFADGVIGFTEPETLVIQISGEARWWRNKRVEDSPGLFLSHLVAGTGRIVAPHGMQIAIETPEGARYLGYRLAAPQHVRPTAGGMLIANQNTLLRLDDELEVRARYQVAAKTHEVVPLDGHHVLTSIAGSQIHFVDLEDPTQSRSLGLGHHVLYEPSTGLVATLNSTEVRFAFFDRVTGTVGELSEPVPTDTSDGHWTSVRLLDPATSNGRVALVFEHVDFFEEKDSNLAMVEIRAGSKQGTKHVVVGRRRMITPAQHAAIEHGDLSVLGIKSGPRIANADRTRFAELARSRLTMHDREGAALWSIAAPSITEVAWTSTGELLALGGGTAVLDPATGSIVRRRCGWEFGLSAEPSNEFPTHTTSVCDGSLE